MSLRKKVANLLAQGQLDEIAALTDTTPTVASAVTSRLYDADALARFRAADALGRVAARIITSHRVSVEQLLHKLAWALNEESGATAWGAPHAMGEIARIDPTLASQYQPLLLSYLDDEEVYLGTDIMVHGVVWALGRVGERFPELGAAAVPALLKRLQDPDDSTRALSVEALGRIGDGRAKEPLLAQTGDETRVERYLDGQMVPVSIKTLAVAALERLRP
ncbi:MAG TPA: HEAT repeat domain-containing protein [Polyangiaceae bacterium]|nr:MAG: HEAT repeat protein [Deltaproteobacteria bacterium ADurb.Bin207]HNS95968.1 HEAT repeat domain-containing protein [Polyangiaceae bacterium]HNZ22647.1 HEAT repeat domain-containing protein [Polyangiaceae bacterium]HOD21541.1 HEAT repeat domain-containing protein [Polyangiaceae bacterium]HOE48354.1 HEAT repeat domain-containing protein [Polyangiaceae bacterium]